MYKEKHILNHHTAGHKLSRYLDVYETTLQTDGHGTISASKLTGYAGDNVVLSATPNKYYAFDNYSLTGANITGDTYTLVNSDVTAQANFTMTGVPVNLIYSGGTVDFSFRLSDPGEHTYFLNYTSSPSSITDQYIVLQYDYKSYHDHTTPGSASVYFNFNSGLSIGTLGFFLIALRTTLSSSILHESMMFCCLLAEVSAALHPVASLIATPVEPPLLSFLCGTLHF